MEPQRILYVNGGIMHRGGIESYMMSYYRNIDRKVLQIDFIVHGFEKGAYDDEINSMGGKIYRVPVKSKDYFGNIKQIRDIFKSNNYKLIHSHMDAMSSVILRVAKECGIPIRIAHSHNTQHLTTNKFKFLLNEYARKNITRYATHFFACSEPAGRWLFGDKNSETGKVEYVKNAIDLDKYIFNEETRLRIRKELNIEENDLIIGHVGRFDYQKNHFYLLEIFKKLVQVKPNSKLVLVGDGLLKKQILEKVEELNISSNIILLGIRDDVNKIINAFDIFILPSHFEGLGIVLVEAQANGLHCITSKSTPREVNISGNVKFLSIDNSEMDNWVDAIISNQKSKERKVDLNKFISLGYSIKNEAKNLQKMYLSYLGEIR
jgi:glycosyltransferase involved in cell wall biosynthesis